MGPDAEKGLAHNDKRRDVEDEVRCQIMKIQPVIEHEPTDEWVEGESEPADEVGEENYPFLGFRGRDDLPFGREPMSDVYG